MIISSNPVWVSPPDYWGRAWELEEEDGKSICVPVLPSSLLPFNSNGKDDTLGVCVCVFTDVCQGSGDWVYVCSLQREGGLLLMFLSCVCGVNHTSWKRWLERVGTLSLWGGVCVYVWFAWTSQQLSEPQREEQHRRCNYKPQPTEGKDFGKRLQYQGAVFSTHDVKVVILKKNWIWKAFI